mmetsp:Transcript_16464/g.31063  ORF Transcript_16464/g.31063 Transcript_16464/m.31063 type:complete len:269 (+) Transcript_16464:71-877(+)
MDSKRAVPYSQSAEDHPGAFLEDCFEDAVDLAPPEDKEHESGDQQLVVKSTFLDVTDGVSARQRFRTMRRAQSDPVLEAEGPEAYAPGQLEDSPRPGALRASEPTGSASVPEKAEAEVWAEAEERSTLCLRNVPNNYSRQMLLDLMEQHGLSGKYDFVYLPCDFNRHANLGYAFVNLVDTESVNHFRKTFDGFTDWGMPTAKVGQVSFSGPHQGLEAHIERYRNSPVLHKSVPDEYKPAIFADGIRQPFPPPTRKIKRPAPTKLKLHS